MLEVCKEVFLEQYNFTVQNISSFILAVITCRSQGEKERFDNSLPESLWLTKNLVQNI